MKIGWREWACLPVLGTPIMKLKVDTGARTSALHASQIEVFTRNNSNWVRFLYHPDSEMEAGVLCEAPIKDQRQVTNSGGSSELRYVIETDVIIGRKQWPIEITLTCRKNMKYNMILGRQGMKNMTVIPHKSYLQNKPHIGKSS